VPGISQWAWLNPESLRSPNNRDSESKANSYKPSWFSSREMWAKRLRQGLMQLGELLKAIYGLDRKQPVDHPSMTAIRLREFSL
jgi:hypothetical protein